MDTTTLITCSVKGWITYIKNQIMIQVSYNSVLIANLAWSVGVETEANIERFKAFYSDLARKEWAELDEIYANDVCFRDPIHELHGRANLYHYLVDLCSQVTDCRFDYLDQVVLNGTAYIKWDMYFSHPKFKARKTIKVRGVSQVEFDERGVFFHEDFYDMGAMVYENIPLFGAGVRWLKSRLGKTPR